MAPGKGREVTVVQAAEMLGCTPETVRRAIRARKLLAHREPLSVGNRFLIYTHDLAAFSERLRTA